MCTVRCQELGSRDFNAISDGQRQRVLLARAICQEPEVIVLDEPTSFLDVKHKLELLAILRRMAKEKQITMSLCLCMRSIWPKRSRIRSSVSGAITDFIAGHRRKSFRNERIRELYGDRQWIFRSVFWQH
ncbi:MAG: ATP-binding cassette domain-containing protein [Lachnospiraceae bacterium]